MSSGRGVQPVFDKIVPFPVGGEASAAAIMDSKLVV